MVMTRTMMLPSFLSHSPHHYYQPIKLHPYSFSSLYTLFTTLTPLFTTTHTPLFTTNPCFSCPPINTSTSSSLPKQNLVVIMGATGTGKSRLSVELATLFFPFAEIINSDKMQVYKGLDITTNKIPLRQRNGVPHHLLGDVASSAEFSPSDFRRRARDLISDITSRSKLPILVGGSNSFIHALLVETFNPNLGLNVFGDNTNASLPILRYNCCFLWMDISFPVLSEYLRKRVDDMVDSGMVKELAPFFDVKKKGRSNRVEKSHWGTRV